MAFFPFYHSETDSERKRLLKTQTNIKCKKRKEAPENIKWKFKRCWVARKYKKVLFAYV